MTAALEIDQQAAVDALNAHFAEAQKLFMVQLDWPHALLRILATSPIDLQMRAPCCAKEPEMAAWLQDVRAEDVLYDVGANVGAYSLIAASQGAQVYAFEPVAVNYLAANRNVLINGLGQKVTVLPFALGEGRGLLRFESEAEGQSGTNARVGPLGQWAPTLTMDSVVTAFVLEPPTLLKVDVEGMELRVLEGAKALLPGVRGAMIECVEKNEAEVIACVSRAGLHLVARHPRLASGIANLQFSR